MSENEIQDDQDPEEETGDESLPTPGGLRGLR